MILSGTQIQRSVETSDAFGLDISPPPMDVQYQPASVDMTLGREVYVPELDMYSELAAREELSLEPTSFVLCHTQETVDIPPTLLGLFNGKSTLARRGIVVHLVAGVCDPGFTGDIVLEIVNLSGSTQTLHQGDEVGQCLFMELSEPSEQPYGHDMNNNHYQNQTGVTPAHDV